MVDLSSFISAIEKHDDPWEIFEEVPVPLEEFLYSKKFLAMPQLSEYQLEIVQVGSQVYRLETLSLLYDASTANTLWKKTKKELIMMLGKGSGKDLCSILICCYIVYLLLCLKDPADYYGKPEGDTIDIVNVAINAKQANNVFFAGLKTRLRKSPWFAGKFTTRTSDIEFNKNIRVHSLNSEGESTEGYNILVAVLDEVDGFDEGKQTSNAEKMYRTLSATVSSRFSDVGKLLLLSFPRSPDGFIMKKYNEVIGERIVRKKFHTFKLNDELPAGIEENEFRISWEEDEVLSYKFSHVWTIRKPTWVMHPNKTIDDFVMDFYRDPNEALGRFAACPQDTSGHNDWYRDKSKIDATFNYPNGVDEVGNIRIKPQPDKDYYIHVDLALEQDNASVALAHVEEFKSFVVGQTISDPAPHIVVDMVRYWKPGPDRPLDFSDIREFIVSLRRLHFNIRKVTFDRWSSNQIIKALNDLGIEAEKLSVGRDHYTEFHIAMAENRIMGPDSELLKKELKKLIITDKGKVDHPGRTGNDLSDAVCGAIFNSISLTPIPSGEVEITTYADIVQQRRKEAEMKVNSYTAPGDIPQDIAAFLEEMKIL